MKAVIVLKDTVAKHDQLIEAIADKLDQIFIRLDRLERDMFRLSHKAAAF